MSVNRQANGSANGFTFQSVAASNLFLKHLKDVLRAKLEGTKEDIELYFSDGSVLYAQAKSVLKKDDRRNVTSTLSKALETLYDNKEVNGKLMYITNIPNPLCSSNKQWYETDKTYSFDELLEDDQVKIKNMVSSDFPLDKFQMRIIRFDGEDDEKLSSIKKIAEEILVAIDEMPAYAKQISINIKNLFDFNGAKKVKMIEKKEVVYQIIVACVKPQLSFNNNLNYSSDYDETQITERFQSKIENYNCMYDVVNKILNDYYESSKKESNLKITHFINKNYINYLYLYDDLNLDDDDKKDITIYTLYLILKRNSSLNKLKEVSGL